MHIEIFSTYIALYIKKTIWINDFHSRVAVTGDICKTMTHFFHLSKKVTFHMFAVSLQNSTQNVFESKIMTHFFHCSKKWLTFSICVKKMTPFFGLRQNVGNHAVLHNNDNFTTLPSPPPETCGGSCVGGVCTPPTLRRWSSTGIMGQILTWAIGWQQTLKTRSWNVSKLSWRPFSGLAPPRWFSTPITLKVNLRNK